MALDGLTARDWASDLRRPVATARLCALRRFRHVVPEIRLLSGPATAPFPWLAQWPRLVLGSGLAHRISAREMRSHSAQQPERTLGLQLPSQPPPRRSVRDSAMRERAFAASQSVARSSVSGAAVKAL